MSNPLRILFAGTPLFAAHHLNALIHSSHNVIGVFTQPDRPVGRGNRLTSSAVKKLAEKYNLPIFQPLSLNTFESRNLACLDVDIMVVVAYGLIIPQTLLNIPRLGCINVHGSLLPRWRGAAPVQRALCANDDQTGITVIQMDDNLDTGVILNRVTCMIESQDTSASLYEKLSKIGPKILLKTLTQITSGSVTSSLQDNNCATYAEKLSKAEARLDWCLSAIQLECCIRAFNPWPVSYFFLKDQLIKVWAASVVIEDDNNQTSCSQPPGTLLAIDRNGIHVVTGKGILTLQRLQPAGKKVVSAQDFFNSRRKCLCPGIILN